MHVHVRFRWSAMPLHLHKCVAWFVSDSGVSCINSLQINQIKSHLLHSGSHEAGLVTR